MKRLLFVVMFLILNVLVFAGGNLNRFSDKSMDNGTGVNNKPFIVNYGVNSVVDTSRRVPGMVHWWDYWTNGQNQRMLSVLGDTVIVAVSYIDSSNAATSTGRVLYYQVSYDGGSTWLTEPILMAPLPLGGAYPDIVPVISAGSRTIVLTGRQFSGGSRGFSGIDVVLGAGSFTTQLTPAPGSDYFSCWLSATQIGGCYQSGDSLFFRKYNYITNTYDPRVTIALPTAEIDANGRKTIASSTNGQNVFIAWYKSTAGSEALSGKLSTDGGTTFGSVQTIMPANYNAGGNLVNPWFGMDLAYKPNSTVVGSAFCTSVPDGSGIQSWKIMYWSPGIKSGNAVVVADWRNTPVLADTAYFNNPNLATSIQVGMQGLSHPTIAWSSDGSRLYCVFTGIQKDSTSYGFFYNDIYSSYSTNDGANWSTPVKIGNQQQLGDEIYPVLSKTGNTPGSFGLLYMASDFPGSASFTNTATPRSRNYCIYVRIDPVTGNILPIGINTISTEVPDGFSLKQNYPNPFNPTTKIRFEIAKATKVNIKIYDVAGRLVEQLVTGEFVSVGTHEVSFDAAKYSSGVYFYTLEADNFKETKKMMLVK